MRACVQRVSRASVSVEGTIVGEIGKGLCVLVGFTHGDTMHEAEYMANKIVNLRIFDDAQGKMNLSVTDIGGELLLVSQFTLYGDARDGRRPSYTQSMGYAEAEPLYQAFVKIVRGKSLKTECGVYGANMAVEIHNDGPVTILIDSAQTF